VIVCPNCGRENPDDAAFCMQCATRLVPPTPPREQRKMVTVVFCDLVGSTALAARHDPEVLRPLLQRYFEEMRGALERHGGTVEKLLLCMARSDLLDERPAWAGGKTNATTISLAPLSVEEFAS
jgi:hypothetical protein